MQARLLPLVERMPAPWGNPLAVPFSVLVGSATHLVWDSFTHPGAPAVAAFPALRTRIVTISDYDVCVFNVLQHLSTALGIQSPRRWPRSAPGSSSTVPDGTSSVGGAPGSNADDRAGRELLEAELARRAPTR